MKIDYKMSFQLLKIQTIIDRSYDDVGFNSVLPQIFKLTNLWWKVVSVHLDERRATMSKCLKKIQKKYKISLLWNLWVSLKIRFQR